MDLGSNIKKYRIEAGLTQRKLAEMLGVAVGTIQQYEAGKREPKFEVLCRIANNLNVPVEYLIKSVSIGLMTENDVEAIEYFMQQSDKQAENELLGNFQLLNNEGKKEANKRVEELTEINKYTKKDPEPPEP